MPQHNDNQHATRQLEEELARQRDIERLLPPRPGNQRQVAVTAIRLNPFQVRQRLDNLDGLTVALRAQGFPGHLQVRPDSDRPDCLQLVFGSRLLRAAASAGLATLPCVVADYTDDEMLELGLAESIRNHDLEPLEEAFALRTILEQHSYTVEQLAAHVGKTIDYIAERLRLLAAPDDSWHASMIKMHENAVRRIEEHQGSTERHHNGDLPATLTATQPASSTASPQADRSAEIVRRVIERDVRTLRSVFERWHRLLNAAGTEQLLISDYLDELRAEVDELTTQLLRNARNQ